MSVLTPGTRTDQIGRIEQLFQQLNWRGRHQFARSLEQFGLTVPQYLALAAIEKMGPVATMSEVSDALHLPRSSMTGITDRLVELGLVQRGSLEGDRRAVIATITAAGSGVIRAVEAINTAGLTRILDGLGEEELDQFIRLLSGLLDGIDRLSNGKDPDQLTNEQP